MMQRDVASFETMPSLSRQDFTPRSDIPVAKVPLMKRVLDISCLLLALPTLLPLFAGIALLIKIVSPGPVFFTQDRIGFMGRRFRILKFRTMKANAETQTHQSHLKDLINSEKPMTKLDSQGDPRVIKFGGILRSSGLDELPQLINVIRGGDVARRPAAACVVA